MISPDPFLSINEVGIPVETAKELTVPIRVNSYNIDQIKELVRKTVELNHDGSYKSGINYVIRPDERRVKVTEKNAEALAESIDIGYIVERQLMDGDIVLFNRQPSLHRMSMMAHEVRVMPHKTFKFNLAVCPPYNADFDGDEMNLHVLQSEEARVEAKVLMRVQEHILSPRFGGPVIGAIHDYVTGCFLLTYSDAKFTEEHIAQIFSRLNIDAYEKLPKPHEEDGLRYWYGKDIFSIALPKDLNMTFRSSICQHCDKCKELDCEVNAYVKIKKGKVLAGTIDDNAIGAFKGKILDKIARDYGSDVAREFMDTIARLALGTLQIKGFTTGIDEEDIPNEAKKQIKDLLIKAKEDVDNLVSAYREGILEQLPGRTLEETLEVEAMKVLGKARDTAGQIAGKHLGLENTAVIMAKSGARGSMLNLSQMACSIGQQAVRGERISRGYWDRTLPHFRKNDLGAEAKGFVESSYKSGLTPTEYFFHSMGGREGLVDTAVRTSRSGYMQRRLINALEDLKVKPDGSVRNTVDTVIQFQYGEDGIDPSRSIQGEAVDIEDILQEVLGKKYWEIYEEDQERIIEGYGKYETDILSSAFEEESSEED